MNERALRVLEFVKVKEQLQSHAASALGKEKIDRLTPVFRYDEVLRMQRETLEGTKVLRLKGSAPFAGIRDIRPSLKRSAIGSMLDAKELMDIAQTISGGRRLKHFLEGMVEEEYDIPALGAYAARISSLKEIERDIINCIDEQGDVLDSASSALRSIRSQIRSAESKVRQQLDQLTKSSTVQKMLQDPIVTIRNNRYCLPVKAEYRVQFGGMVHEQSASGSTLFMEPNSVVTLNNKLSELRLQEEKEIERILLTLTVRVAEALDPLEHNIEALAELDLIFAKAYYARSIKATKPLVNEDGFFRLKKARHPLIPAEEIVPVSFELGDEFTSLVITGPNTGGKTVTLKTLGLLTLMTCSGLFIPAQEESEIAVVSAVYADIGDEQSIEQSLSTFSSHMTHIVDILEQMDENALILLDELGAGTDPTEGAALAMAILDAIYARGARVAATTHYSELKAYAYNQAAVMNASVEFDVETLQPTYRLLVGIPGRSNAFSIAKRLGLPQHILEQAEAQIGEDDIRVESMISSLEANQKRAEQELSAAEHLRQDAEKIQRRMVEQEQQFQREKERRLAQAEKRRQNELERKLKEADDIITELRSYQKHEPSVKDHLLVEAKKKLEQTGESIRDDAERQRNKGTRPASRKQKDTRFQPGDEVMVHSFGQKGHIVEQTADEAFLVQLGIMKMKVQKDDMEKVHRKQDVPEAVSGLRRGGTPSVSMELDLRGKTIDEATVEIDRYLDSALMAGLHQVHIIHGKGTGQLRKGVQEFLRKHKHVSKTRSGEAGEGGSGVTVAILS